jgi:hypothetical protein
MPPWTGTLQLGTNQTDRGSRAAVDTVGNGVVVGYTDGVLPGQTAQGDSDAFIIRFDSLGNIVWQRQFGTGADAIPHDVAMDASGNAYVVGWSPAGWTAPPMLERMICS